MSMDLRDFFAAKAMPCMFEFVKSELRGDGANFHPGDDDDKQASSEMLLVAQYSYFLADAMMEARK